jgi:hypothetical protein
MAARVELREISNEEGNRLLGIVRRSSGSVVTWRRAQSMYSILTTAGLAATHPRFSRAQVGVSQNSHNAGQRLLGAEHRVVFSSKCVAATRE